MRKTLCIFLAVTTYAQAADLYYTQPQPNDSYLSNTKYLGEPSSFVILDKAKQQQIGQQYADAFRYYDYKMNSATMTLGDQYNYYNTMSSMGQGAMEAIKNYQINSQRDALTNGLKKNEDVMAVEKAGRTPAAIVGGAYALYKGTSYTIKVSDKTSVTPGASISGRNASLGVSSPFVNTSVAASQTSVTTSINRGLVDHISMTLSNTVQTQSGATPPNNSAVSLNYGISL